ncbi:MAG: hypothetical protein QW728_05845 [Thermoplasmata archaeon]
MFVYLAGPFILRPREGVVESEMQFRANLGLSWVSGVIFNAVVERNGVNLAEYDALLYSPQGLLLLEYKDSKASYQQMTASRIQKHHDIGRVLARALGFSNFAYKIVVNQLPRRSFKGGCEAIPLAEIENYTPDWENTMPEKNMIAGIIRRNREFLRKTNQTGDPEKADFNRPEGEADRLERINKDLENILKMFGEIE